MNKYLTCFLAFLLLGLFACSNKTPDESASQYPKMPNAYRNIGKYNENGNNKANINPLGMAIYDAAETEAEENYFGTVVVPLDESKRILEERKLQKQQAKKE